MIKIESFVFNPFSENTYVMSDETGEAVIIDPGCYERSEKEILTKYIDDNKLKIKYLLNTHCHIDHVLGNQFIKDTYTVPLLIHELDLPVLKSVKVYAPSYGFVAYHESEPDGFLKEGDIVSFGNTKLKVLFVPGHAPGHIAFYHEESKSLLSGDVLFEQSIGRTDLPGGSFETLIQSIHKKLFTLPDDVVVYSGHGNTTTIGEEKIYNPFCALHQQS
jgi:glyoxylase-like metal-dependent hydrolase (beta-lactamase superfamily II)